MDHLISFGFSFFPAFSRTFSIFELSVIFSGHELPEFKYLSFGNGFNVDNQGTHKHKVTSFIILFFIFFIMIFSAIH
jgi:hypothetical protein